MIFFVYQSWNELQLYKVMFSVKKCIQTIFGHPGWVDGEIKTELLGHAPVLMTTAMCEIVHGNAMRGSPVYSGCHGTLHSMFLSEESAR